MPHDEPRIVVLGRRGCHLCDVAHDVVAEVAAATGVRWEERDVDADEELTAVYGAYVPVVLVDGTEVARFRVDAARLKTALRP